MYDKKGTMMNKNKIIRICVHGLLCIIVCGMLTGCKVRDAALVLPVEEEKDIGGADRSDMASQIPDQEEEAVTTVFVYVCGAVVNPGVVELPEESRVTDALAAAGGFTADAQENYVNLAAKVKDGEKIYFPTLTETEEWEKNSLMEQNGIVDINRADVAQLMTLPGIGEARAKDIISYREKNGLFQQKEDLKKVSGIKDNMYEKLADKITVE